MNLTEFAKEVHENAKAHGWWDEEHSFAEIVALCHSELSEALEEYRNQNLLIYYNCCNVKGHPCAIESKNGCLNHQKEDICSHRGKKPEGVAVELADCILRILDYCGRVEIDIEDIVKKKHEYNKTRPYRHGNKRV